MKKGISLLLSCLMILMLCLPATSQAAYIMSSVNIDYVVPRVGATAASASFTLDSRWVSMIRWTFIDGQETCKWHVVENGSLRPMDSSEVFEMNKAYRIVANLRTRGTGYDFDEDSVVMFNGKLMRSKDGWYTNALNVTSHEIQPEYDSIQNLDLRIPIPKVGNTIIYDYAVSNSPYVTISTVWYDVSTNQRATESTFIAGKSYYAEIDVTCNQSAFLANNASITVNSNSATTIKRGNTYVSLRTGVTKVVASSTDLTSIPVTVPAPKAGQTPNDISVSCSEPRVRVTNVRWFAGESASAMSGNETFKAGESYTCRVRVEANSTDVDVYVITVYTTMPINGSFQVIGSQWGAKFLEASSLPMTVPAGLTSPGGNTGSLTMISRVEYTITQSGKGSGISSYGNPQISTDNVALSFDGWNSLGDGKYQANITLNAAPGYGFPSDVDVFMNRRNRSTIISSSATSLKITSPVIETQAASFAASAKAPTISDQPTDKLGKVGDTVTLSLTASSSDGGRLSYQWYTHPSKQNSGGTSLGSAAQGASYTAPSSAVGVKYYYCVVTNTNSAATTTKTATTASNAVAVEITSTDRLLQSITSPKAITGLDNGVAKTAAGLTLPTAVTIKTDGGDTSADVSWNVGASSYDITKKEEQVFTVQGTVALPSGVVNTNKVSLTVQVSVTVGAAKDETPPTVEEFTVRYDANGGTGTAPAESKVTKGDSYTIAANPFSRTGYIFAGWRTSPTGGTFRASASTFVVESNTTLCAQWTVDPNAPAKEEDTTKPKEDETTSKEDPSKPVELPPTGDSSGNTNPGNTEGDASGNTANPVVDPKPDVHTGNTQGDSSTSAGNTTLVFTIDSKVVMKNGTALPELDVPAMIINGRTMIPFRYFIETALGGVANFDASTYTITATVQGHTIVMVIDELTIYVDGKAIDMTQAPTIVDSRTLVPLRLVETIAQSVGWDPLTRKATIIM